MPNPSYWNRFGKALAKRDGMICVYCHQGVFSCNDMFLYMEELDHFKDINYENPRWDHKRYISYRDTLYSLMATVDHVIPRSMGGIDSLDNMVIACHGCNSKKGTKTAKELMEQ